MVGKRKEVTRKHAVRGEGKEIVSVHNCATKSTIHQVTIVDIVSWKIGPIVLPSPGCENGERKRPISKRVRM